MPKSSPTISLSLIGDGSRIGPAIASVDEVGVKSEKCLLRLASFLDEAARIGRLRFMLAIFVMKTELRSSPSCPFDQSHENSRLR